jgi:hypothetical protein
MSAIGHGWWLLWVSDARRAAMSVCMRRCGCVEVTAWSSGGVARGCEGADVLVVVVRWCCGGRWVVWVQTKVMCVSVSVVVCNGVGVAVVVM